MVPQRQPIRRDRRVVVALPLERQPLIEVIETLRANVAARPVSEQALPQPHLPKLPSVIALRNARRAGYNPTMPSPGSAGPPLEVDWPLFGELCRGLALRVAQSYDPEVVVGIARAGVIPGAVIASILQRPFLSMSVAKDGEAAPPVVVGTPDVLADRRVLLVDETCDSGDTFKVALSALRRYRPADVKTAVSFRTGEYAPDFHAMATESHIVLPWDRLVVHEGELITRPDYARWLGET